MPRTAIIIGLPETCRQLQRQLDLVPDRPVTLGWIVHQKHPDGPSHAPLHAGAGPAGSGEPAPAAATRPRAAPHPPILGTLEELEVIIGRRRPEVALVTLPAAMTILTGSIRARLGRLGLPVRFMPTLGDQLAGTGPWSRREIDLGSLLERPPRRIDEASVRGVLEARRVLITGAGGSIGSELARIVCRFDPRKLILVERSENALFEIDRQIARRAPRLDRSALLHDIVDAAGTLGHLKRLRPDVIFHAAAHKHVPLMEDHPAAAVDNNLFGTISVADASDRTGAERFVMISTDKAVRPRSVMGATKRLAELYVQHMSGRSETLFSMVRFGNVLGSTGSVLDIWSREISEGGPLTVTHPDMTRYFMTIAEAAALVIQSAALVDSEASGTVFLLDMGQPIKVLDLAHGFAALHGLEARVVDTPRAAAEPEGACPTIEIVFTTPRPGEKLHEELVAETDAIRPTAHPDIQSIHLASPDPDLVDRIIRLLSPGNRPREAAAIVHTLRNLVPLQMQPTAA
ncbi:MAG: polysaccharide biosynthesis protein [Planctomycetes bacterium]|nr:polysaccharide biosynthesis protein [Planctomycetota bacterium]